MRTVKEVSSLTGVSIRTLHHYDSIGLLPPTETTESGYRLYDDKALERLQMILLFRELKFSLREIRQILDSPTFDRAEALRQQIELLRLQKEHIENLIDLARGIQMTGGKRWMDFKAFDTTKLDAYAEQAKAAWGKTAAYQEFEEKSKNRSAQEEQALGKDMMEIFREMGKVRDEDPAGEAAQKLVARLQAFITEHYYNCTPQILRSLGSMYAGGGEFTANIDKAGGEGTAVFADQAIQVYCDLRD